MLLMTWCIHVTIPVTEMSTPNLSHIFFQIQWNFKFMIPDFMFFVNLCTFLNLNGLLCVLNFMFSLNLHFIFLVLAIKIYLVLCFVVQFSQFIIRDNKLPSTLTVANSSLKIRIKWLHSCNTLVYAPCDFTMAQNVHEGNFLPPWSKQITHAKPALNWMHLRITVAHKCILCLPHLTSVPTNDHCSTATTVFS
jgi:hypothetical protein